MSLISCLREVLKQYQDDSKSSKDIFFINSRCLYYCMKELGGQIYFLINNFFYYYKRRSNLNFRATKAIVYIYHKYFVVRLKLTNYAENTALISLSASFFTIFRGNSCVEAK